MKKLKFNKSHRHEVVAVMRFFNDVQDEIRNILVPNRNSTYNLDRKLCLDAHIQAGEVSTGVALVLNLKIKIERDGLGYYEAWESLLWRENRKSDFDKIEEKANKLLRELIHIKKAIKKTNQ